MIKIIEHMNLNGMNPGTLILDGKVHRFRHDFKNRRDTKESGWYCGFQNFTTSGEMFHVVRYGCWGTGEEYQYQTEREYSPEDFKSIKESIAKQKLLQEKERREHQEQVAVDCEQQFASMQHTDGPPHPNYLSARGYGDDGTFGARWTADPLGRVALRVPMRDINGRIWSLQKIPTDGEKTFAYGGRVKGLFHTIGNFSDVIYIAEGFATGAAVHLATGTGVAVAFTAHNMIEVAKELQKRYPDAKFIICGDNDQFTHTPVENPGKKFAEEAAKSVGGKFVVPNFENIESKPTDFDDLRQLQGIEAVRAQIEAISPQEVVEFYDENYIVNAPYPDTTMGPNPKPKGTMTNVRELLRRLRVIVRYNVISKEEEKLIPGGIFTMDNKSNATLAYIIDWCVRVGIPTENLSSYITAIADLNPYNPVATWIDSKPWDGQSRLADFYATVTSTNEPLKERLMRAWMISAVAAAYEPNGVSAHGVLVFQGDQYIGKTKWFKSLVPAHLEVTADGVMLRPDDKDSVYQVISKWMVELGELDATFRKADIAQLKAFVTKDKDTIRRPYAKSESNFCRRTVFFASVNELDFLKDPTGNRRFWTISCQRIDYNHKVDMQQVWAEFKTFYLAGEEWRISADDVKVLNEHNEDFQSVEPVEERIRKLLEDANPLYAREPRTATEICLMAGILNPTNGDCRVAGRVLRKMYGAPRKSNGLTVFRVPQIVKG